MYNFLTTDLKIFAKHLNVLIVDDEKDLLIELKELLSLFFNKVYTAYDGDEALELYKKNKCDIVLTDLNMPNKNGVELSRQIRILDKNQVIMVLSGHIDTFVIDLIDIGIQALIIKPYDLDNFLQKLLVQCENIVLKKEFEKLKLNTALEINKSKLSTPTLSTPNKEKKVVEKKEKVEIKPKLLMDIAEEVVGSKPKEKVINDFISNFNVVKDIDDSMWKHICEDIQDLNEYYEDNINKIALNGFNEEIKQDLIKIFDRYNSSLLLLPGLEKLAMIFAELADVLHEVDLEKLDNDHFGFFDVFEYFYEDIIKFFNVVFIDKETKNINYLTDSMKSSVFQLKVKLGIEELEDEEELELF